MILYDQGGLLTEGSHAKAAMTNPAFPHFPHSEWLDPAQRIRRSSEATLLAT